jgi:glutaredoxin
MIVLWQFEGCPYCANVRSRMTELALDCISVNAPEGHPEKDDVMDKLFGSAKVPAIWDTQTGTLLQGDRPCLDYLNDRYGA